MDDFAAVLGDPGRELKFTIDANHTDMIRFWGKTDRNYEIVAGELSLSVQVIIENAESK